MSTYRVAWITRKRTAKPDLEALRHDMTAAARDLLGGGFVAEYYQQAAAGFVAVAESYLDQS
jgi:3-methyladenine DNA glycosylase Mpg